MGEVPVLLVLALVLALAVKALLVQAFSIPSRSMQQTLDVGDRVVVNKLSYRLGSVRRGQVVVFDGAGDWAEQGVAGPPHGAVSTALRRVAGVLGLGGGGHQDYVKRVIGLPGDRVMCCDATGHVVVRPADRPARSLVEPYLFEAGPSVDPRAFFCAAGQTRGSCPPGSPGVLVPAGRLWMMGDHRGASADSRAHLQDGHSGTIPVNSVIGRAFLVVWPVQHLGRVG